MAELIMATSARMERGGLRLMSETDPSAREPGGQGHLMVAVSARARVRRRGENERLERRILYGFAHALPLSRIVGVTGSISV